MEFGINSGVIREFSEWGVISLEELGNITVELSLADVDFLNFREEIVKNALILKEIYNLNYTIHAPYQDSIHEHLRINFASNVGLDLVEDVFEIAHRIDAETVVMHAGDYAGKNSVENVIKNLKKVCKIAEDYGITIALENIFSNERGDVRIGETPEELLYIYKEVNSPFLGINIDVGHAYISSLLHSFNIEDFLKLPNIVHFHIHNNYGLTSMPWDKHLPIFKGSIDYATIYPKILKVKAKNVIFEIKTGSRSEILESLGFISGKVVRRCLF